MALLVRPLNTPWAKRVAAVLARQALAATVVAVMAVVAVCARPRRVLVVVAVAPLRWTRRLRRWLQRTRLAAPLAAAMRHWLHDAPLAASTLSFHTHKSSRKG